MSEIFGAVKHKSKIIIASAISVFAILLVTFVGVLTFVTNDTHTHRFDYKLVMNENGKFDLVGVCNVRNCESPYYNEADVDGVTIFSFEQPTCSTEGTKVYAYNKDGVTIKYAEKVPTIPHNYEGESVEGDASFSGHCKFDGCTDPEIVVNDFEGFELDSIIEATCSTPKKEIYKCTLDEGTFTMVIEIDEYLPHTLNGVSADSLADVNGNYPEGTTGINVVSSNFPGCGGVVVGEYTCDECEQNVSVQVVLSDHNFVYNPDNVTPPSLDGDGKAILCCTKSLCTETLEVTLPAVEVGVNTFDSIPATELYREKVTYRYESSDYGFTYEKVYEVGEVLSHNYVNDLVPDSDNEGTWNVVGKCEQADCQMREILIVKNVDAKLVKDTTSCQGPGELEWEYEHEGEILKAYAYMPFPSDHKYSSDSNPRRVPNLEHPGSIDLNCSICNQSVSVVLPKIVVGVNAIFVEETSDGGFVYKYVHETEYDYPVELTITIYQHAQ